MRIPLKIFIKSLKQYSEWINARSSDFNIKIKNRIMRFMNTKGLIQTYLGLNREKEVNTKNILNFIKPCNL